MRAAADVWLVPSGVHWVWPTVAAGHVTRASTQDQDDQNRATGEPRTAGSSASSRQVRWGLRVVEASVGARTITRVNDSHVSCGS